MKEARIILPYDHDNVAGHEYLARALVNAFGGYTSYRGVGAWRPDHSAVPVTEDIVIYDIAAVWNLHNKQWLVRIAREVCALAKQVCVYVRFDGGNVEFFTPKKGS